MKILNITCTQCGTQIKVNSELNKCMCPNCGAEMSIRKTTETQKDTAFINGYKAELGRQKALYEINQQKQAEAIALQEEQKRNVLLSCEHILLVLNYRKIIGGA